MQISSELEKVLLFTRVPLGGTKYVPLHKTGMVNQPYKYMNNKLFIDYTWQNNNWKLIWKDYKWPGINPQMANY